MKHEDQINEGPLLDDADQRTDQGTEEQKVKESESTDKLTAEEPANVDTKDEEPSVVEREPEKGEVETEVVKDEVPDTGEPKSKEEVEATQQEVMEPVESRDTVENQDVAVDKENKEESSKENHADAGNMLSENIENNATEQAKEEPITIEATKDSEVGEPSVEVAETEIEVDGQTESAVMEEKKEQLQDEIDLKKDAKEEHQIKVTPDKSEAGAEPIREEPEQAKQETKIMEPEPIKQEAEPIKQEAEPIKQEPEPIKHEPEPIKQELEPIKQEMIEQEQEPEQIKLEPEPLQHETEPVKQDRERANTKEVEPVGLYVVTCMKVYDAFSYSIISYSCSIIF